MNDPSDWELIVMDVPKGQRIAELRREIEHIREKNRIYRSKGKHPGHRDRADNERRLVRLDDQAGVGRAAT